MPTYKLVSFKLCPFVQRSVITLLEKGMDYDIEYIDLSDKPKWFLDISPLGKVPVLVVDDDVVLFESAVINEYIEETASGPRMHPEDPLRRAQNRATVEFISSLLFDQYKLSMADEEAKAREHLAALHDKLERLETQLGDGPYFNGTQFSLVDAAAAPFFQRARWIADIAADMDATEGHPKVRAWQQALLERDSVARSTVDDIVERYVTMLRRPQPDVGDRPSWLGSRAA